MGQLVGLTQDAIHPFMRCIKSCGFLMPHHPYPGEGSMAMVVVGQKGGVSSIRLHYYRLPPKVVASKRLHRVGGVTAV